jgi:hypothetical protein
MIPVGCQEILEESFDTAAGPMSTKQLAQALL